MRFEIFGDEIYITSENTQDVCFLDRFRARVLANPEVNQLRFGTDLGCINDPCLVLNNRPSSMVLGYQDQQGQDKSIVYKE